MIFVIIGHDSPDGQEKRKLHRQAHLDRMDRLDKAGKVLLAGPFILVQRNLKRMLAYSSLEHVGLICAAVGMNSPEP